MKYGTFVDFGSIVDLKSVKPMSAYVDMLLREKKKKERKARRAARKAELSWRLWLFRQRMTKRR